MKRLGVALVVLVVALAGGWLILDQVVKSRLHSSIAQFRASLQPDGSFTYATASAAPLRLGADFTQPQVRRGAVTLQAKSMALSRVLGNGVGVAVLDDVYMTQNGHMAQNRVTLHAERIEAHHLSSLASGNAMPAVSDLLVGSLRADGIDAQTLSDPGTRAHIATLSFDQQPNGQGGTTQDMTARQVSMTSHNAQTATVRQAEEHSRVKAGVIDTRFALGGMALSTQSSIGAALGRYGYGAVTGSAHGVSHYDTGAKSIAFGPSVLALDKVGTVTLQVGLDHLPPELPGADGTQALAELAQSRLTGLRVTYDDAGLTGHVIDTLAKRSGITPVQFRANVTSSLQTRLEGEPEGPQRMLEQQALRFLNDPRRFAITLAPPSPMPLLVLGLLRQMQPKDAARALGFGATAD